MCTISVQFQWTHSFYFKRILLLKWHSAGLSCNVNSLYGQFSLKGFNLSTHLFTTLTHKCAYNASQIPNMLSQEMSYSWFHWSSLSCIWKQGHEWSSVQKVLVVIELWITFKIWRSEKSKLVKASAIKSRSCLYITKKIRYILQIHTDVCTDDSTNPTAHYCFLNAAKKT